MHFIFHGFHVAASVGKSFYFFPRSHLSVSRYVLMTFSFSVSLSLSLCRFSSPSTFSIYKPPILRFSPISFPLPAFIHIPPSLLSLSVSMLLPCLRLSLPLFAFNSWGHPGPLGSYPRMLSRLTSCRVAFWTERTTEPGLDRCLDSNMYSATAPPRKRGIFKGSLVRVVVLYRIVITTANLWLLNVLHVAL